MPPWAWLGEDDAQDASSRLDRNFRLLRTGFGG
jgi:hypothetical protein